MNQRRTLMLALGAGALTAPFSAPAQQPNVPAGAPGKIWRIGMMGLSSVTALSAAFYEGMAALGYQRGRNVQYEERFQADFSLETFEQHARELVGAKVDLIWAPGTPAAASAQKATVSMPIVFALIGDPVHSKLIRSFAAPGGNLTGMSLLLSEMWEKRVELLHEIFPAARRIGVLHNPLDASNAPQLPYMQKAAKVLGKELMLVEARKLEDFAAAFAQLKGWRAQALLNAESTLFLRNRQALIDAALQNRWPTLHSSREYAEAGGTIAYGADYAENCRSSAYFADRIFKGAKPADLPVQQPTKFNFVLNLKAAKALGLTIPYSVLLRADRVIE